MGLDLLRLLLVDPGETFGAALCSQQLVELGLDRLGIAMLQR